MIYKTHHEWSLYLKIGAISGIFVFLLGSLLHLYILFLWDLSFGLFIEHRISRFFREINGTCYPNQKKKEMVK